MMSVCFVDPSAIKTLVAMYKDFKSRGLIFCLADCSGKITKFHLFLFVSCLFTGKITSFQCLFHGLYNNDSSAAFYC
jgi:hypothetical protein